MKHYTDSTALKILNMISEFVLSLVVYGMSSFVRLHISGDVLKKYSMSNVMIYVPFGVAMAVFFVVVYMVLGDYKTLHYRSLLWELKRVFMVNLIGGLFGGTIMFFLQEKSVSRGLLIIYLVFSFCAYMLKRIIFHNVANSYLDKNVGRYRVLVCGTNNNVVRYAKELLLDKEPRYLYAGYVAESDTGVLPDYQGTIDELSEIIDSLEISQLVISEENLDREKLETIIEVCEKKQVEVSLIPVFSEYFDIDKNIFKTREGTKLVPLARKKSTNILGVNIAVTNIDEVTENIINSVDKWRGQYICVSNVHTTVMSYEDEEYCSIQNGAVLALPDGGPLSSYSRTQGEKNAERVTGPDLMKKLLMISGEHGWSHFFYGASQETLDKLKATIEEKYPGAKIAGMISPPFRALTPEEDDKYVEEINDSHPDFVWVGLGAPKQERWMAAHKGKVNALMLGVGAAFDYESGNIKRAPKWMQKCSLEWLYRLLQDPKRLFKRYFVTNIKYMWLTRR